MDSGIEGCFDSETQVQDQMGKRTSRTRGTVNSNSDRLVGCQDLTR